MEVATARLSKLKLAVIDAIDGVEKDNMELVEHAISSFEDVPEMPFPTAPSVSDEQNKEIRELMSEIEFLVRNGETDNLMRKLKNLQDMLDDVEDEIELL